MTGARLAIVVGLMALVAGACGGGAGPTDGISDAEGLPGGRADGLIARRLPHVEFHGGRFLGSPEVHTVTFAGDDPELVARLERFGDTITTSGWWREVVAGYCAGTDDCIGDGSPGRHVRVSERLPREVTPPDIEAILNSAAAAGRFGTIDPNTLVVTYLPPGVALTDAEVLRYCDGPRALHHTFRHDGVIVPYALIPRCGDEETLTVSASHEILEATTNPEPTDRGFAFGQDSSNLGFTAAGVEPADPCGLLTRDEPWPIVEGFAVHRAWSNSAASVGTDPCVPAPADRTYLALVPGAATVRLTEPGTTTSLVVEGAADHPTGPWSISAIDLTGRQEGRAYLDVALDRQTIATGASATLTLTLRRPRPSGPIVVGLISTAAGHSHQWPLAVVTR